MKKIWQQLNESDKLKNLGLGFVYGLATNISASNCTNNWFSSVAATGTFVKAASMTGWTIGRANDIPSGWTIEIYVAS